MPKRKIKMGTTVSEGREEVGRKGGRDTKEIEKEELWEDRQRLDY
jgi:hypothetical protein